MDGVRFRWSVLVVAGLVIAAALVLRYVFGGGKEDAPASPEVRRIEKLHSQKDLNALAKEAAAANAETARRAVAAMGRLGREAAPRIRPALRDPRPAVRERAATAYAQTRNVEDEKALGELGQLARADPSANVRASAASALGSLAAFEEMDALLAAMGDGDEVVRRRAAIAAERIACVRVGFKADDPPDKRSEAIARLRAQWEQDKNGAAKYWTALRKNAQTEQPE